MAGLAAEEIKATIIKIVQTSTTADEIRSRVGKAIPPGVISELYVTVNDSPQARRTHEPLREFYHQEGNLLTANKDIVLVTAILHPHGLLTLDSSSTQAIAALC